MCLQPFVVHESNRVRVAPAASTQWPSRSRGIASRTCCLHCCLLLRRKRLQHACVRGYGGPGLHPAELNGSAAMRSGRITANTAWPLVTAMLWPGESTGCRSSAAAGCMWPSQRKSDVPREGDRCTWLSQRKSHASREDDSLACMAS